MKAYRYSVPLTQPIQLGPEPTAFREGILIEDQGRWAEASPLPHFSSEGLDDVIAGLRGERSPPPALEFALSVLNHETRTTACSVNALLQGEPDEMLKRSRSLAQEGCTAIKLKVGRRKWESEAELVARIRDILRPDQALRLDANRTWDWHVATDFANAVEGLSIQYIEEPLRDPHRLEEFATMTGLRYALDESLLDQASLAHFPNAAALVIKPTLLGGINRISQLSSLGKPLIFSACYESGVGISHLVHLVNRFQCTDPAGLDTYQYLAKDTLTDRLQVRDWQMHVPETLCVNTDRLQEITL